MVQQAVEQMREVLDLLGDDMTDTAFALNPAGDLAGDLQEPTGDHRPPEPLVDLTPDHDIGDAELVFERDEDDAFCRAGALADEHEPGDCDTRAIRRQFQEGMG